MSYEHIRTTHHKACKDHVCDASAVIRKYLGDLRGQLTFREYRLIASAKRDGWKIKKGQEYRCDVGVYEGEFQVLKSRPDMHQIIMDHELYSD